MTTKNPTSKPKYTLTSWVKHVRASNARFEKLSAAQKRVCIAKDVLEAIAVKRLQPTGGVYYRFTLAHYSVPMTKRQNTPLLLPFGPSCEVCAQGALFTAKLDRLNSVTVADAFAGPSSPAYHLQDLFERQQLDDIEHAFESVRVSMPDVIPHDYMALSAYGLLYGRKGANQTATKRLVAIMENIVRNQGTFKPRAWTKEERELCRRTFGHVPKRLQRVGT